MSNQPMSNIKIEVIQGGLGFEKHPLELPPILHETTNATGIKHMNSTISMARIEERMISVFKRLDRVDEGFNKWDKRMDELEQTSFKQGQTLAFSERLFWVILTGSVSLVLVYLR